FPHDVTLHGDRLSAFRADLGHHLAQRAGQEAEDVALADRQLARGDLRPRLERARGGDHARPGAGERQHIGPPDPAPAADDDRDLTLEFHRILLRYPTWARVSINPFRITGMPAPVANDSRRFD